MQVKRKDKSAHGLAVVLIVMTALAALVAAAVQYTQGLNRYANRSRSNVSAQAIGDACLEFAFSEWRQICRNTLSNCTTPCNKFLRPPATSAFASIALPTAAMFPDVPNFTATTANDPSFIVSNYKVQAVDSKITLTSTDPPVSSLATTTEPFPPYNWATFGANKFKWYYLASCDVTLPSPSGPVTTKMRRIFEKKVSQPFMHFMFFNDDLELQPNSTSPLTIYGAIHTNGKLYTGTSALTVNATVPSLTGYISQYIFGGIAPTGGITYADDWVTGFKSGDTFHTSAAALPTVVSPVPPSRGQNMQVYDWDPTAWNAADGDTTNDSPHEIVELPPASGTDFMAKSTWSPAFNQGTPAAAVQRESKSALIRINIGANDVITIFGKDWSGNEIALNATTTGPGACTAPEDCDCYFYQFAYNMWMTALGGNASGTLLITKTANNGRTTSGSTTLNVAAVAPMNFVAADVGRVISGPGIPLGTTITAKAANNLSVTLSKAATATANPIVITLAGFTSIQDNREGGTIGLVDIDLDVFKNWDPKTAYTYPDCRRWQGPQFAMQVGNIPGYGIYIHADPRTATPTQKRAIRIKNGGTLTQLNPDNVPGGYTGGVTDSVPFGYLITDNPVYIWGDFNSGRTPSNASTIPACNNDATKLTWVYDHTVAGTTAAIPTIMADAVTLLSNNWSDANAASALNLRPATNTTVNCNIVAGNVPTSGPNGYSGGGENFIRLMEDWSGGKRFTFTGSMVQLYQSKTATGKWVPPGTAGNVYNEPTRNWYWLSGNFGYGLEDLYTVSYRRQKWSPAP